MKRLVPQYKLFTESFLNQSDSWVQDAQPAGRWRFTLESIRGEAHLEASGDEEKVEADRLALLAVVRGLEALDQPARVALFTRNPYVSRGLRFSLEEWRENDWCWERFGEMVPIANADSWHACIERCDTIRWNAALGEWTGHGEPSRAQNSLPPGEDDDSWRKQPNRQSVSSPTGTWAAGTPTTTPFVAKGRDAGEYPPEQGEPSKRPSALAQRIRVQAVAEAAKALGDSPIQPKL